MNNPNPNIGFSSPSSFSVPYSSTPPAGVRPSRPRFAYAGPSMYPRPRSSASKPNPNSSFSDMGMTNFGSNNLGANLISRKQDASFQSNNSEDSLYYSCNESFYQSPNQPHLGISKNFASQQSNPSSMSDFYGSPAQNRGHIQQHEASGNINEFGGYSKNFIQQRSILQSCYDTGNLPQPYDVGTNQDNKAFPYRQNTSNFPCGGRNFPNKNVATDFPNDPNQVEFDGGNNIAPHHNTFQFPYPPIKKNIVANNLGKFQNSQKFKNNFGGLSVRKKSFKAKKNMAEKAQWHCDLCNLDFTSEIPFEMHLRGAKHNKKLKAQNALEAIKSLGEEKKFDAIGNAFHCGICNLTLNSSLQLQMHLDGTKHKTKIQRLEQAKEGEKAANPEVEAAVVDEANQNGKGNELLTRPLPEDFDNPRPFKMTKFSCEICSIAVNSEIQLQQHLGSKKHDAKVQGIPYVKIRKNKKQLTEDKPTTEEAVNNLGEGIVAESKEVPKEDEVAASSVVPSKVLGVKSLQASFVPAEEQLG